MRTLSNWLEDRLRVSVLREFLASKLVPTHYSLWHYCGGVTLLLLVVQVITGVLLLLYYRPTPDTAYESVRFIVAHVPFGWLVRSVHAWAASLMVAATFVHLFSMYFLKAYRAPRELTWMSGCALLALTFGFSFSGLLLPWNEVALFATTIGTDIIGNTPIIGGPLAVFFRGGHEVGAATLTRFFGFHVALLPFVTTLFVLGHLALVQVHSISEPLGNGATSPRHIPFYPHFVLREILVWLGVMIVLIGLATFAPWELGDKGNPFMPTPTDTRPAWYFTSMYQTLSYLPPHILGISGQRLAILAFGLLGLVFVAVPFLDRRAQRGVRSPGFTAAGVVVLGFLAFMTLLAYVKPQ